MTKQEQIEFIKQKCVEANPSIMDLKHGCKISLHREEYGTCTEDSCSDYSPEQFGSGYVMSGKDSLCGVTEDFIDNDYYIEDIKDGYNEGYEIDFKILGRDIRLSDILTAVWKTDRWIVVRGDGLLYLEDDGPQRPFVYYNLLKDNLNDQSDECVEFIYNLLK